MVSEDIERRRGEYLEWMRAHGTKSPAEIVKSVAETQGTLLSLFSSVTESHALRKPGPDDWSLHELALHSVFTEQLIARLVHHMSRGGMPPAKDLEGAGLGMMPHGNAQSYAEVLADLRTANEELLSAVRNLPEIPNTEMLVPHPFFGPLNCLEWAGFQRVHDSDHIQHAEKILAVTNGWT